MDFCLTNNRYLDKVSGGIDDYAYDRAEFPYAYTVELPDKGNYGFVLPKEYIRPVAEETHDGMTAYLMQIANRHNLVVKPSKAQMAKIRKHQQSELELDESTSESMAAYDASEQQHEIAQKRARTSQNYRQNNARSRSL